MLMRLMDLICSFIVPQLHQQAACNKTSGRPEGGVHCSFIDTTSL